MFEDRKLPIFSYNVETIIAEKLQAVVALQALNSRMKDFYDLYFLFTNNDTYFNNDIAKKAIQNTFSKRDMNVEDILTILEKLYNNKFMTDLWNDYRKKYIFVENVKFKEVLDVITDGVKKLGL